jgi:hypothetical protein
MAQCAVRRTAVRLEGLDERHAYTFFEIKSSLNAGSTSVTKSSRMKFKFACNFLVNHL